MTAETGFAPYLREIERRRPAGVGPENLVVLERVESTNRLARTIVDEYENEAQHLHPLLILAFGQSGGRGRHGRSWQSPAGLGVYASRVLTVDDPEVLQTLPLLVGAGLCRALGRLGAACRLKWPNDLLVEGVERGERRKIGGILIEASIQPGEGGSAVIGFGVNQGQGAEDLPATGTSLRLEGVDISLAELTWELVTAVEGELAHLGDTAYAVAVYRELSVHQPGERISCRVGNEVIEGTFNGFDEHGRLRLERDGQEVLIAAGEVLEP
ncbi:MAG TPA: biotin--[acetyl-CoA-carboxylase] ligase [Thermoanaerobaculia bacterium]|nr:biotin--[acetyl-CoA-carboxylase] ligase [Thermoanaerobaculia bacterium]